MKRIGSVVGAGQRHRTAARAAGLGDAMPPPPAVRHWIGVEKTRGQRVPTCTKLGGCVQKPGGAHLRAEGGFQGRAGQGIRLACRCWLCYCFSLGLLMAPELCAGPFCGPVAPPAPPVAVAAGAAPPARLAPKSNPDRPSCDRPPRLLRARRGEPLPMLSPLPTGWIGGEGNGWRDGQSAVEQQAHGSS